MNSAAETEAMITSALTSKYEDGSVSILTTNLALRQIGKKNDAPCGGAEFVCFYLKKHIWPLSEPKNCPEETLQTVYGEYIWSETFPQVTQEMTCRKPRRERAYRLW